MPPPSFIPDGFLVETPEVEGMVRSQGIIFLVIQKAVDDTNAPWSFPSEETLDELSDFIIGDLVAKDEPRVCDTFLDRRMDPEKGIATITLCTEDMRMFDLIRREIRNYTGSAGWAFETYSRAFFMKQNAVTIYITKKNKIYVPSAIIRFLFDKYPDLISNYSFLYMKTYDQDREDHVPGRRSRIGDAIAVFGGADFLSKIAAYSEDHVFHLSKRWRITIKGGQRVGSGAATSDDNSRPISPGSLFAAQLMNSG